MTPVVFSREQFLDACPFLRDRLTWELEEGSTLVMGGAARLACSGTLSDAELDQLFGYWNWLADSSDRKTLDILATGAIELFNDTAASQELARTRLKGRALQMLEDMRAGWGQPDFRETT